MRNASWPASTRAWCSHCESGPASRPTPITVPGRSRSARTSCSGSLAAVASLITFPCADTAQMAVLARETSKPNGPTPSTRATRAKGHDTATHSGSHITTSVIRAAPHYGIFQDRVYRKDAAAPSSCLLTLPQRADCSLAVLEAGPLGPDSLRASDHACSCATRNRMPSGAHPGLLAMSGSAGVRLAQLSGWSMSIRTTCARTSARYASVLSCAVSFGGSPAGDPCPPLPRERFIRTEHSQFAPSTDRRPGFFQHERDTASGPELSGFVVGRWRSVR